jgi:hypothetical protein
VVVDSTAGSTSSKFAINYNRWQTANAVLFCPGCDLVLMHVVDVNLVLRTSKPLDGINRFFAGCAPGTEDLNLMLHCLFPS